MCNPWLLLNQNGVVLLQLIHANGNTLKIRWKLDVLGNFNYSAENSNCN